MLKRVWLMFELVLVLSSFVDRSSGQPEYRIVKGRNCTKKEYSYLGVMMYDDEPYCGTSLVASKWVLTAAHCCDETLSLKNLTVVFGLAVKGEKPDQSLGIERMYPHKDYTLKPLTSDLCLIELNREVTLNDNVKLSTLATTAQYEDLIAKRKCGDVLVMGFGDQNVRKGPGIEKKMEHQPAAQCTNLEVVGRDLCHDHKIYSGMLSDTIFCAIDPKRKGSDACQGDSGGPVYCQGLQIGLVSAGFGCGQPEIPGFYCRVDVFRDFIEGMIKGELKREFDGVSTTPQISIRSSSSKTDRGFLIWNSFIYVQIYGFYRIFMVHSVN